MYNIVLTNYGNTQISNKVILDGVILLSDYISNISTVTSVTGYSVKLDIPARGNVKDKIGNILIRDDSTNTYVAKTILFYKNVNSEKKIIAGFSQNSAIINKLNKAINLFLSFDFSVFTNGFQFALVQAGFSQASQNVDGLVHIEDPNIDFDDSYSVYSKVQIDNKLSSYAQTSDIPTKVSQLDNDLGFITSGVVPTNYVTVNTAQDITAAKTFKNAADTTKIDGKEIVISGTETYNVEPNPDFPDTPTSATATIETKIDNNIISCNGNSIGYYRNYYAFPSVTNPGNIAYYDGIEIKSDSYDSIWGNNSLQHERYSLTITSTDPYADSRNYIEGLAFSTDIIRDNYVGDLNNGKEVLFAISKDGAYFNTSVNFNSTTQFASDVLFSSSTYVNQNNLFISDGNSSTSDTIADYVKQASLYYNRANSVITATSETVIEPSSNYNISLGTSTNKFSNIYATTFNGDLSGNASSATTAVNADHAISADSATTADSATKAAQDGNGNTISSYYCTLSTEQTISGKKIFNGGNVDFVLGDNDRNISFRYSPTYTSWTWITCSNGLNGSHIKLHFTNNNTDVIQLTHSCTSESVNNVQTVKSLVTTPSVDNVWQLGSSDKRLKYIYARTLGASNKKTDSVYTSALFADNIGDYDNAVALMYANKIGLQGKQVQEIYVDHLGSQLSKVKTMHISGGHSSHYITIDNSGGEPTIAPDTSNYCYLGTSSKHWYNAYINNLYIGSDGVTLQNYIINLLSGTNSNSTAIGSIRVIRIGVTNKDSDVTIFSAGSNVSGYTIYDGSLSDGTCNYINSTLSGTWKLLSALKVPSGISTETYSGSLYAIAIRVA